MVRLLLNHINNQNDHNNNNNEEVSKTSSATTSATRSATRIVKSRSSKKEITTSKIKKDITLNPFNESLYNVHNNNNNNNHDNTLHIIQNNLLTIKYYPKEYKDLIGLESSYYYLKSWYNDSLNDLTKKFLIIIGKVGCGKTGLIKVFCKENNIQLFDLQLSEQINESVEDSINKFIYYNNIFSKENSKKLIFIDNYKNNSSEIINNTLINSFYTQRTSSKIIPPILIICSDTKGSRISELKNFHEVHYINDISLNLIKIWIQNILHLEGIKLNHLDLLSILNKTKNDKQLLLNIVDYIKVNGNSSKNYIDSNNQDNISNFINNFYKDFEIDNFEYLHKLFNNIELVDLELIFKTYDTDGYTLANLVHENYLEFNNDIESIAKSAEHISNGDYILNRLYNEQKFFSPWFHCLESIIFPSYWSRCDIKPKIQLRTPLINNRLNILLNNRKIINKLNMSIFDILFFKIFLKYSIIKTKIITDIQKEYLFKLLSICNFDISLFELIYKHFNNISDNKTNTFTKKFKELLIKIINEYPKVNITNN